jgi:hypothetical protein
MICCIAHKFAARLKPACSLRNTFASFGVAKTTMPVRNAAVFISTEQEAFASNV